MLQGHGDGLCHVHDDFLKKVWGLLGDAKHIEGGG
jgi:hypothetical protein